MSESFVFSKNRPLYSITNPNTPERDYLDSMAPFSFFSYVKYLNSDLSPLQINDSYVEYIKEWNIKKRYSSQQINQTIQDRYIELLKDITLKYSTTDEKRFLSNIDFSDPDDLDIIIPFYSKKIREICDFYAQKREKLKFKVHKNKIKGTPTSLEKSIYETITDVVFSDVLEVGNYQKLVDEKTLLIDLNIEVEELYDLYTSYLDNDPTQSYELYDVKTELRKTLFSANLNAIDADIFINFDQAVKNQLFENVRVFLTELGRIFTINYDLNTVNLNCKPDEKLYNLVTNNKPKAERLVKLKDSLIKKYIGCDFYYITTGSTLTDVTSSILFKADNPSGNLLNRHFPTTATVEEESELHSCRRIGLFFTPEKNSILYYSVPDKKYKIDSSKLEPNKLYIFPDPDRYGNTSGLSRVYDNEYPLIHICDYTRSVKNQSCFYAEGDINSNPYTQDFYAYFSKNQLNNNFSFGKDGLKTNFAELYDKGALVKWNSDIYGNQYGLFKNKSKSNLIDKTSTVSLTTNVCEDYDGGPITFFQNGLLPEVVKAGNKSWVSPNIWASNYYYNLLIEGGVGGYYKGLMERGLYDSGVNIVDGLTIDRSQINGQSFDILLNTLSGFFPLPLNILDGNSTGNNSPFAPDFDKDYVSSSLKSKVFDAGEITDYCGDEFDFKSQTHFFLNEVLSAAFTLSADKINDDGKNFYDIKNSYGTMYVKDSISGNVITLLNALSVQFGSKYNDDFSEILDFNVFNDFFWIRTKNNLIFEKIGYEDVGFSYSGTGTNVLSTGHLHNYQYNVSDPFIFEDKDYAMVATLSVGNKESNNFYIIPTIYKIDYNTCVKTEINSSLVLSAYENNSVRNTIKLFRINQPILTYNSRNNIYCVIATVEDENEFSYVYQMKFTYKGSHITNEEIKFYNFDGTEIFKTINFLDNSSFGDNDIVFQDINSNANVSFYNGVLTFS